jgi:hypothetical protein
MPGNQHQGELNDDTAQHACVIAAESIEVGKLISSRKGARADAVALARAADARFASEGMSHL